MTGLVAGIAVKAALGGALGKVKQAASWFFLHPAWLVALVACLFVLLQMHEAHHWQKQDASDVAGRKQAEQAAATNKASLDGALAQINDNNKRVEAAHAALLAAEKDAAAANARSDARYVATKGAVARLEASAATKGGPPCVVSQEALKALGGL